MLKTVEDISVTKKRLLIEIPADTVEREIKSSLEKLKQKTRLPGFRPGKAPMELIEKRYGREVESDVLDRIIAQGYADALKEANITPVAHPVVEEKIDYKRNQPVSLNLTVEVMPKLEKLIYENIAVKDIPVTVSDADVESVLKRHQEEKATYEPSDGPAALHDLVVLDYTAPEGIELKDQVFKVGGTNFPMEFSEGIVGKKKGETFAMEVSFPEDHPVEAVAGKRLPVDMTIREIKKARVPAIDDEFAKDVGFENLDALKGHLNQEIGKAKNNEVAKIQKAEIVRKLTETHDFDVPESLLEREVAALASAVQSQKTDASVEAPADETVRQEVRPDAIRNVKASLLIEMIGREQNVSVSEDDLKAAILSMARRLSVAPENLMKFYISRDGSLDGLKHALFEEKVLDLIRAKAVFEKGEQG